MSNCLYFPNDKHPIVTVEKSITVLKIKSNMSELKTKGMKKLNNVKSNPNNKQPRINALFIKLLCLIYLLSQINTQAIITPVNTHHNIVSIFLELNDE